ASFTTKVVVPVGESYIISGEKQITLDVPAYISAAGYTMLPVRAVAVALGINTNNVLWDQATKTVTILYGQRIITMVAGQKVVYVNGSAIPASASVEIVDGRTFLPMRDLATALGVTDITWDAATKTATLNGNQK
ncbi:MAG: copper amine oxidase N-terminal domain-containing protein, partial [Anaerotignum sp.]